MPQGLWGEGGRRGEERVSREFSGKLRAGRGLDDGPVVGRAEAAETPCQRDFDVACWYNIGSVGGSVRQGCVATTAKDGRAATPLAASEDFCFVWNPILSVPNF